MTRFENAAKSVHTSERERARKHFFLSTFQNEANKEVRESTQHTHTQAFMNRTFKKVGPKWLILSYVTPRGHRH